MKIYFLGQTKTEYSLNISGEKTINMFPEKVSSQNNSNQDNTKIVLYGTPGFELYKLISAGYPIRGLHVVNDKLYVVCYDGFYRIDADDTLTKDGTINTTAGRVSMSNNGTEILVVDGFNGYIYTISTNTIAVISDADFPDGATLADFLDGYFIVLKPDTGRFYISASYDGTSWAATDFATAEAEPDYLVSFIVNNRDLWLLGENTTEIWYNSGLADFPFSRINGGFMEWGCDAKYSIAKTGGSIFFLAKNRQGNGVVVRSAGYQPQIISTPAIEQQIKSYSKTKDAFGFTYMEGSHLFYVLTFPDNATFAYDVFTNMWHERQSYKLNMWRVNCYAFWNGKHYIGDYSNGKIYEMKLNYYTEDGTTIIRKRRGPIFKDEDNRKNIIVHDLNIDMETGVGIASGQGSNPQAMLKWSNDSGHTWSSERLASIGKIGEYNKRLIFRRLGQGRGRIFELTISDPVKIALIDAYASAELLNN